MAPNDHASWAGRGLAPDDNQAGLMPNVLGVLARSLPASRVVGNPPASDHPREGVQVEREFASMNAATSRVGRRAPPRRSGGPPEDLVHAPQLAVLALELLRSPGFGSRDSRLVALATLALRDPTGGSARSNPIRPVARLNGTCSIRSFVCSRSRVRSSVVKPFTVELSHARSSSSGPKIRYNRRRLHSAPGYTSPARREREQQPPRPITRVSGQQGKAQLPSAAPAPLI